MRRTIRPGFRWTHPRPTSGALAGFLFSALAAGPVFANWGEQEWGTLTWGGVITQVPGLGLLGAGLLTAVAIGLGRRRANSNAARTEDDPGAPGG